MALRPYQLSLPLGQDLMKRLDDHVMALRQADGPGTRINRSTVVRLMIEQGLPQAPRQSDARPVRVRTRKPFNEARAP